MLAKVTGQVLKHTDLGSSTLFHSMLVQNGDAERRCSMLSNDQIYEFTQVSPPAGRVLITKPDFYRM